MALLLAFLLCMRTADAQAAAVPSTGVAWGVGAGSGSSSAALSGNMLAITQSLAVSAALWGVTQVWPVGRVVTAGASVMGQAGRMILQSQMAKGALTGAALAAALAISGDASYDAGSNSFQSTAVSVPPGSNVAWESTGWSGGAGCTTYNCTAQQAGQTRVTSSCGSASLYVLYSITLQSDQKTASVTCQRISDGAVFGATIISRQANYVPPTGTPKPATNAQIESAIAATPSSFTNLWSAGGCDSKANTYIDLASLSLGLNGSSDPCAVIIAGGSPAPATVPTSNNPYAWPNQVWTDAQPGKTTTHTLGATSTLAANTGVDQKANPVKMQTAVTDAANDGTNTTTTGTTTTQTKSDTKPDAPAQTTTATFNGNTGSLYTPTGKTWSSVLANFQNTVKGAPWYTASVGFFSVTISGGSCPHWSMPANKWMPALDAGQFVCSSTMLALYAAGGVVVLIVAAWAAFRIALL
ncbi:hypothetical protein [Cupriavidus basilensis]|uniref:hypothetical protein n=1 Tax=Cupriavidus basilensis TaxID=68895 RepID=UPI00157A8275|nr:hypothetical protein [Cupriavidus basilensis]NUA30183.1 hypothetical protein [Cupriavidus basilensis]